MSSEAQGTRNLVAELLGLQQPAKRAVASSGNERLRCVFAWHLKPAPSALQVIHNGFKLAAAVFDEIGCVK